MEPEIFGRYRLLGSIGRGGMAEVFLAKLEGIEGFERRLALKRVHPQFTTNPSFVQMFIDEARLVGHFNHPNVVQMFDFGKIDDTYYIAMEYVEGSNIAELMSRTKKAGGRIPTEAIVEIGIQISQGMDYAHKETDENGNPLNIIHRDLTPHNILISRKGTVKITDFGIAKASMNTHMTQAGMIKGKVPYMSPEQAMGMPLDNRSDIFSIGINLFEMCTLKRLFDGPSDFHVLQKVMAADIPNLQSLNPDIPEEFERIIRKSLAQNRDDRYATAGDMVRDLNRLKFSLGDRFSTFRLADYIGGFVDARESDKGGAPAPRPSAPSPSASPAKSAPPPRPSPAHLPDNDDMRTVMIPSGKAPSQAAPQDDGSTRVLQAAKPVPQAQTHAPPPAEVATARAPEVKKEVPPPAPEAAAPTAKASRKPLIIGVVVLVLLAVVAAVVMAMKSRPAQLTIQAVPNMAKIFVDGQKVADKAPYTLAEAPTGQPIKVKAEMKGFKSREESITLSPGDNRSINLELEMVEQKPGTLVLSSVPPGAKVLLGGAETGWATPCRLSLAPGQEFEVTLMKEGFAPLSQKVKVEEGVESSATWTLTP